MKIFKYIIIVISILNFSCEEVIELDLNDAEPRLVIDANINWEKGTNGKEQEIILTMSSPYYKNSNTPALGANVEISNTNNDTYTFTDKDNNGFYTTNNFSPELNEVYELKITYKGETYKGSETLMPASAIYSVEQTNDTGFTGTDIEIKTFLKNLDVAGEENYYFFEEYLIKKDDYQYSVGDDDFVDGSENRIFNINFYSKDSLLVGDQLRMKNIGCSKRYGEFMFLLLSQTADGAGGPFSTTPATVRGNMINITNEENYPFGFFRLSETATIEYTVTENGGTTIFNE